MSHSLSMSRRAFVRASGLAAAAAVLAPPALLDGRGRAHAGQFTGRIKKAVKYQMIQEDLPVVDKFKLLKDLGFDGVEAYHRLTPKLDVKEFSREKQMNEGLRKGFDVEIGEGDCDWPAVRQALLDINYSGWATAEVPGGDRKRLADIAQRMDRALDL